MRFRLLIQRCMCLFGACDQCRSTPNSQGNFARDFQADPVTFARDAVIESFTLDPDIAAGVESKESCLRPE